MSPPEPHPPDPAGLAGEDEPANPTQDLTVVMPSINDTAEMPYVPDPVARPLPPALVTPPPDAAAQFAAPPFAAPPSVVPSSVAPPFAVPPSAPPPLMDRDRRARLSLLVAGAVVLIALLALGVRAIVGGDGSADRPATAATVKVDPASVHASASSTQDPEGRVDYVAANTLDGDPATAWNSDGRRDGPGPGITLTYRFAAPVDLRGITLLNGYQKTRPDADLWRLNERVKKVRVITDAGSWTWTLADTRAPQTLRRDLGRTRSVRLEVVSVYRSEQYLDLAVSEVSFTAAR
jgi:hypothetical protein